jgi:hypothetical protein
MEAILLVILTALLVISILANVALVIGFREFQQESKKGWLINHLYETMITSQDKLIGVELLNSTPLEYLKDRGTVIVLYYFSRLNRANQTEALDLGCYFWKINNQLSLDRKEYILGLLYQAAGSVKTEIWADLLVQSVILENQLQEDSELDHLAELIGFIITISNQIDNGERLSEIFEAKINTLLEVMSFNESLKNKIEVAMMRICNSLNV